MMVSREGRMHRSDSRAFVSRVIAEHLKSVVQWRREEFERSHHSQSGLCVCGRSRDKLAQAIFALTCSMDPLVLLAKGPPKAAEPSVFKLAQAGGALLPLDLGRCWRQRTAWMKAVDAGSGQRRWRCAGSDVGSWRGRGGGHGSDGRRCDARPAAGGLCRLCSGPWISRVT
ncbi:hypothetical protein ACLOJK_013510 [Asimina triloba]